MQIYMALQGKMQADRQDVDIIGEASPCGLKEHEAIVVQSCTIFCCSPALFKSSQAWVADVTMSTYVAVVVTM